jgi:hypothetical protein
MSATSEGGRYNSVMLSGTISTPQRWLGAPSSTRRISCRANFAKTIEEAKEETEVERSRPRPRSPTPFGIMRKSRLVETGAATLANREMQVNTSIDEADVGGIREPVLGRRLSPEGLRRRVMQVRKSAQVVQDVVTYDVGMSAPNLDLLLLPGLTANVRIITAQRSSSN